MICFLCSVWTSPPFLAFFEIASLSLTTILKIRLLLELSPHPRNSGLEDSRRPGTQRHSGGNPPREPTTLKRAIWTGGPSRRPALVSRVVAKTGVPSGAAASTKAGSTETQLLTPADYSGFRSSCASVRHHVDSGGL
ncbi:hypothetical protein DFH09DRAFT_1299749 [Mycena vulgaris]|nr:hypothetical protein DFH09DRAFT_1299749 [Mycena vulgaris]